MIDVNELNGNIKYDPDFADSLPSMMENGETLAEVCAELEITETTFYAWTKRFPEFRAAYEKARTKSKAWWMKQNRMGSVGAIDANPALMIFNTKVRFGVKDDGTPMDLPPDSGTDKVINDNVSDREAQDMYTDALKRMKSRKS
jgi:hypothetical protein